MCESVKKHRSNPNAASKVDVHVLGKAISVGDVDPLDAVYEGVYLDQGGKEYRFPMGTPQAEIPAHLEKYVITVSADEIRVLDVKLASDGRIVQDDRETIGVIIIRNAFKKTSASSASSSAK